MRKPRTTAPGTVHHVISRFVDRDWFFKDDYERGRYLDLLGRALAASDWLCFAYALMSNHIHLSLLAGPSAPGSWLKRTHSPFAVWMNKRHERLGPLFADRPAMWTVQAANEGKLTAYIHNNPVRAGLVGSAGESTWTSHAAYVGRAPRPKWLAVDEGLERCGFQGRPQDFDQWVAGCHEEIEHPDLRGIYRAARRRGAVEIGIAPAAANSEVPIVARPFAHVRPDPRKVVDIISSICGLDPLIVSSRSNVREPVAARKIAVHCGRDLGISLTDMGTALGMSRQGASRLGSSTLDPAQRRLLDVARERIIGETYRSLRAESVISANNVPR
jgi:putative transposase